MRKAIPFLLSASTLMFLVGCQSNTASVLDGSSSSSEISMPSDTDSMMDEPTTDDSSSAMDDSTSSLESSVGEPSADARIIEMTVTDWEFSQKEIKATKGEKLIVRLTGIEGEHSFGVKDLGINVPVKAGETVDIEIPTDKAGSFQFRCMIPCGSGHKDMTGTVTII